MCDFKSFKVDRLDLDCLSMDLTSDQTFYTEEGRAAWPEKREMRHLEVSVNTIDKKMVHKVYEFKSFFFW